MTNKVLCPWCGAEMEIFSFKSMNSCYAAWFDCKKCGAISPKMYGWETEADAINVAYVAALRRYEPPIRPMTLEEARDADYCYLERYAKGLIAQVILLGIDNIIEDNPCVEILEFGVDVNVCPFANLDKYGKTWRCWPRKPTEEERQAAGWEDAE